MTGTSIAAMVVAASIAVPATAGSAQAAGLDWWKYRDLGALVRATGADTVSANWQVHDPELLVRVAIRNGLR